MHKVAWQRRDGVWSLTKEKDVVRRRCESAKVRRCDVRITPSTKSTRPRLLTTQPGFIQLQKLGPRQRLIGRFRGGGLLLEQAGDNRQGSPLVHFQSITSTRLNHPFLLPRIIRPPDRGLLSPDFAYTHRIASHLAFAEPGHCSSVKLHTFGR